MSIPTDFFFTKCIVITPRLCGDGDTTMNCWVMSILWVINSACGSLLSLLCNTQHCATIGDDFGAEIFVLIDDRIFPFFLLLFLVNENAKGEWEREVAIETIFLVS